MEFVKVGVSLRPDNDETEVMPGFLCFHKKTESASSGKPWLGYTVTWISSSSLSEESLHIYSSIGKKTRNAIALGRKPADISQGPKLPITQDEAISMSVDDIYYLTLDSQLTLNEAGVSVCITRLILYLRIDQKPAESDIKSDQSVSESKQKHEESSLPLDITDISSLGGARMPAFWFERDLYNVATASGLGHKYPSLQEVEKELRYWFNAVNLDLKQSPTLPSLYFVIKRKETSSQNEAQTSRSTGLLSLASNMGMMGLNVVSGIVGQPIASSISNKLEDATFEVLNTFSHITRITKETGSHVLEHRLTRPILPFIPSTIRDFFMTSDEAARLLEEYEGAGEYLKLLANEVGDRLKTQLHRPRRQDGSSNPTKKPIKDDTRNLNNLMALLHPSDRAPQRTKRPVSAEEWIAFQDAENGKLKQTQSQLSVEIFLRGIEHDIRPEVWKYLLGVYDWSQTEEDRRKVLETRRLEYENLKSNWETILADASGSPTSGLGNGLGGDEREDGDVVDKLKERKYRIEKDVVRTDRNVPFFADVQATPQSSDPNEPTSPTIKLSKSTEMLRNVLLTYTVYNFEIGYVQGMNDLLSPILAVMESESESFWCFVHFMETMKFNFYRDQSGMRRQLKRLELLMRYMDPYLYAHFEATDSLNLFCCFRWMLVLFKREFTFDQILVLWEIMWSCPLTQHLHVFVALAILNEHRQSFLTTCSAFDETLKYINDLSCQMDVQNILYRAENLFQVFRVKIRETAQERLGVDVATGQITPLASEKPSKSSKSVKTHSTGVWGEAMHDLDLEEMSDEDIWQLLSLLEKPSI